MVELVRGKRRLAALTLSALVAHAASGQTATTPGAISAPFPTTVGIALEWGISGDSNNNGVVDIRYRVQGSSGWALGLPLTRVPAGSNGAFSWASRHSGSLFDLASGTEYEIELSLSDPDGGNAVQVINVATASVPEPAPNSIVRLVTPANLASMLASVNPGEILDLQPGDYPGFTLDRDGLPGAPVVLRGQTGVQINGELRMFFRQDVILDSLTVNGRIRFNGSNRISIQRCRVNASADQFNGDGIVSFLRSESAYIVDNTVVGTTPWVESALGASGANRGEGIVVTGPGHVIAHNRVSGFRDNISLMEDGSAVDQFSIDIYANELSEAADDAIEADFCFHNCRIWQNRVSNAFIAFSSQPSLGGPTYFVRNAAYNVAHVAFKLYRESVGDVLLHNTVVKAGDGLGLYPSVPVRRTFARNNLTIGGPGGTLNGFSNGSGRVIQFADLQASGASLDYNAYGSTVGSFEGQVGAISFSTLAQLRALTTEIHAVEVDMGGFAQAISMPNDPMVMHTAKDLRLAASATAIDAGIVLPGINHGYSGANPDAGAYERGQPLPEYGPRTTPALFADGFE